nr:hypothetical protein BCV15_16845 [Vibrio cyclitrophicus]
MDLNLANALQSGIDAAKLIEHEKAEINAKIDELISLIIDQLNEKCRIEKTTDGSFTKVDLIAKRSVSRVFEVRLFGFTIAQDGYPVGLYTRNNSEDMCFSKDQLVQGLMDIVSTPSFGSTLLEAINFSEAVK